MQLEVQVLGRLEASTGELGGTLDLERDPECFGTCSAQALLGKAFSPSFPVSGKYLLEVIFGVVKLILMMSIVQDAEKALEYGVNGIVVSNHGESEVPSDALMFPFGSRPNDWFSVFCLLFAT